MARVLFIAVALLALASSILAACPEAMGATPTRYSTWANKATSDQDEVTIPAGTRILLDETIPFIVKKFDVYGAFALLFALKSTRLLGRCRFALSFLSIKFSNCCEKSVW